MLHNFPVMILARDEASPIKINKREAAWALKFHYPLKTSPTKIIKPVRIVSLDIIGRSL